jgi:hypothetical protein
MSFRNALYLEANPDASAVQAIGPTEYDLVLVAFLHTRPNDPYALFLNDTQIYQEVNGQLTPVDPTYIETLAGLIQQLKSGYSTPKTVLLSIGPFQSDFDQIAPYLDTFVNNLVIMAGQLNLDGYDFDYEGNQTRDQAELVANLAIQYSQAAAQAGLPANVTAAPYYGQDWWAGILEKTATSSGNAFSWFNVQFYAGDSNTPPSQGPAVFESWRSAIANANTNIADPSDFIVPGINADPNAYPVYNPSDLTTLVQDIYAQYPTMGGAFVWNYQYVEQDISAWAEAAGEALD